MLKRFMFVLAALTLCTLPTISAIQAQDVEKPAKPAAEAEKKETYEFKSVFTKREIITLYNVSGGTIDTSFTMPDGQTMEQSQPTSQTRVIQVEILEVSDEGKVTKFLSNWHTCEDLDPMTEEVKAADIQGMIATFTWNAEKEAWSSVISDDSTCESEKEMKRVLNMQAHPFLAAMFGTPEKAVAIGDTWELSEADIAMMQRGMAESVDEGQSLTMEGIDGKFTFDSVTTGDEEEEDADNEDADKEEDSDEDNRMANCSSEFTFDLAFAFSGMSLKGKVTQTGVNQHDLDDNRFRYSQAEVTGTLKGAMNGADIEMTINSTDISVLYDGTAEELLKILTADEDDDAEEGDEDEDEGDKPSEE